MRLPKRIDILVRSTPGRPAWATGVRAAIATVVPLLAAGAFHWTGATWMSLGGFNAAIADRGGAYRLRAATMASLALCASAAAILAALVGRNDALTVLLAFVLVFVTSIARVFGTAAAGVGTTTAVTFLISIAFPSETVGGALTRGLYIVIGAVWAMILALWLWPLRPYRPLRLAVARVFRALGDYADTLGSPASGRPELLDRERIEIRTDLENARALVAVMRRGGPAESRRGERLRVLVEAAEQLFGTLIALTDAVETAWEKGGGGEAAALSRQLGEALRAFVADVRRVAVLLETESRPMSGEAPVPGTGHSGESMASGARGRVSALEPYMGRLVWRLDEYSAVALAAAAGIESGAPIDRPLTTSHAEPPARASIVQLLRDSLAPDSIVFRHALRAAIVTALAVAVTRALGLPRGYWVTLTAVIILQPWGGATLVKALQRVLGTVAGGVLTALLGALIHDQRAFLAVIFVFAAVCAAYLRVNYLVFSVFLTPTFVILAEMSVGDWHLAGIRVLNTVLGGALALGGAWLLWPTVERSRFPEVAADLIRACAAHLRLVGDLWRRTDDASAVELANARRRVAVAALNADASLERVLAESAISAARLEPMMTLVSDGRRLLRSDTALAAARYDTPTAARLNDAVQAVSSAGSAVLREVADAVAKQRRPAPIMAPFVPTDAGPASVPAAQLERVSRQIEVIHDAAIRLSTATSVSGN